MLELGPCYDEVEGTKIVLFSYSHSR